MLVASVFRKPATQRFMSNLAFTLTQSGSDGPFGPRLGVITCQRDASKIEIQTPGLITGSSRGVVPHLSRDHTSTTEAIRWIQLPFESFLQRNPPIVLAQKGQHPLHTFLGHDPNNHLVSLCVRDPADMREMPANGKDHITAYCIRGVRKITPTQWKSYMRATNPDIVTALPDIPFTAPPHSQKRTTKSIERSTAWLADMLASHDGTFKVLVSMVGGTDSRARGVFAEGLVETLYGKDMELIYPLKTLDEGVWGYVFDLAPLRATLEADGESSTSETLIELTKSSLDSLPKHKPRIAHSATSPHEILRLVQEVGIDLFDVRWAQRAADLGIALDFRFPVVDLEGPCTPPLKRDDGKLNIGHNLFDVRYAHEHTRFSSSALDAASVSALSGEEKEKLLVHVCRCRACSPSPASYNVTHSSTDAPQWDSLKSSATPLPPVTRAYVHHLLHTHEMSSHTLLAMHNLTVLDKFFEGIRGVLSQEDGAAQLAHEIARFSERYDETMAVFTEAQVLWAKVERERGKGRLAREKSVAGDEVADI